ncbi:MAG: cytochrome c oxidase subunit II [Alphaproteobacteria bacterium]
MSFTSQIKRLAAFGPFLATLLFAPAALAQQPTEWGLYFQEAASPVMRDITSFHDLLLVIITVITIFVAGLLLYVMVRFNRRANPEASTTSHNTLIEVIWTVAPILILVVIAIPSFRLLYLEDVIPEDIDLTIKATGNQWYWSYEYPDHGNFSFDSIMKEDDELEEGEPRLLAVDNRIVVPVNKKVRVLVTASDVIHNFAMPAFGVKMDGVPGRMNETWFLAEKEGTYYGQCSELCGIRHAFMPIQIDVVSEEEFAQWIEWAKTEYADASSAPITLAASPVSGGAQDIQ